MGRGSVGGLHDNTGHWLFHRAAWSMRARGWRTHYVPGTCPPTLSNAAPGTGTSLDLIVQQRRGRARGVQHSQNLQFNSCICGRRSSGRSATVKKKEGSVLSHKNDEGEPCWRRHCWAVARVRQADETQRLASAPDSHRPAKRGDEIPSKTYCTELCDRNANPTRKPGSRHRSGRHAHARARRAPPGDAALLVRRCRGYSGWYCASRGFPHNEGNKGKGRTCFPCCRSNGCPHFNTIITHHSFKCPCCSFAPIHSCFAVGPGVCCGPY